MQITHIAGASTNRISKSIKKAIVQSLKEADAALRRQRLNTGAGGGELVVDVIQIRYWDLGSKLGFNPQSVCSPH
jgi:hypothetical protein